MFKNIFSFFSFLSFDRLKYISYYLIFIAVFSLFCSLFAQYKHVNNSYEKQLEINYELAKEKNKLSDSIKSLSLIRDNLIQELKNSNDELEISIALLQKERELSAIRENEKEVLNQEVNKKIELLFEYEKKDPAIEKCLNLNLSDDMLRVFNFPTPPTG